tara:strand:+ start:147 stop:635 length:489 start_codon:yes stop_codon:yes gene_type:complete
MWTIIRYKKNKYASLLIDLKRKFGSDPILYQPKIMIKNKNEKSKELNLLGDYVFFFNEKFNDQRLINSLKYCRGLKSIIEGCSNSQIEIKNFINKCKLNENENGYLSKNIFEIFINKEYKFFNGPFSNYIFKIINLQKDKLKIKIGNWQAEIDNSSLLYHPI